MLTLDLGRSGSPLRLLVLGAHPDDIEIGCGGTILRLAQDGRLAEVTWVVLSGDAARAEEARASADAFLADSAARPTIVVESFRDGFFPYQGVEVKEYFETLKSTGADLILTHRLEDRHQDHRLVAELTWNTFRDHLVLEYEVPKYEGDLALPNVLFEIPGWAAERKVELLLAHFSSQHGKHWFTADAFQALLRLRGLEAGSGVRYAEGFHGRKLVLG